MAPRLKFSKITSARLTRSANISRALGFFKLRVIACLFRRRFMAETETSSACRRTSVAPPFPR